ncbi:MAG: aminopeptidase P family protein [Clostridia bacterium]|nr:aminopeptidase P family protein [Clostridia bacterium]
MNKTTRLRQWMTEQTVDAVLITSKENMQWYSGFSGDTGWILVTHDAEYFITDFRYMEMAEKELEQGRFCFVQERTGGVIPGMEKLIGDPAATVGIEYEKLTIRQKQAFDQEWGFAYVSIDGIMHELRTVKTPDEIARMREGAAIVEEIFSHMLTVIRPGVSEYDLLAEMQYRMNKSEARPSFDPIIAGGPNSSLPHAVISARKLQIGDFLTMDFGVLYKGVCTDFTRTVALGGVEEELELIYNIVHKANLETEAGIRPGVSAKDVDAIARNIIADAGYGAYYGHGGGHGVGVEIHEAPWLSTNSTDVLQENMVLTVEPGIYLPGKGGVRIEDMVVVTKDGIDNFYTATKDLIII